MNKKKIIGALVALVVVVGVVWFFTKGGTGQQISRLDVNDTVGSFYNPWLKAAQEPETANPNRATLAKSPILSKTLRDRLVSAVKDTSTPVDPVLCQTVVPTAIAMRSVSQNETEAQVLVTSKDKSVTEQAFITLKALNGGWYINDITCSAGEFAPEREFTFETVGFLLKGSIPKPYNPKNWHIVFEQNGQPGNVAPLLFDAKSQCTALDGTTSVCKPDQFTEATKVSVHGQMTEAGATVTKLEFVKE